jgi:hypothetical protein
VKISQIKQETHLPHVRLRLKEMAEHFRQTCEWIDSNINRTIESAILNNLLRGVSSYLELAANNLTTHISALGVAVRGLYEIQLRTQLVILHPEELTRWQTEAVSDKIQMLDGLLGISTDGGADAPRKVLTEEIENLRNLLSKHGLQETKPFATAEIAKKLGKLDEHKSLFKLFSKIVHPTSYLINNPADASSEENFCILHIHAQIYAWDSFQRICEKLSLPKELMDFQSSTQ